MKSSYGIGSTFEFIIKDEKDKTAETVQLDICHLNGSSPSNNLNDALQYEIVEMENVVLDESPLI